MMSDPPTEAASLRDQITTLRAELDSLRARYDTLLEVKNRAAERYKADYKKWRDFKRWLFGDAETDEHVKSFLKSGELAAYGRESVLGKRKELGDFGPDVDKEADNETKNLEQKSAKVDLHSSPVVASKHQRRTPYHSEPSKNVLSPSPSNNKDPFVVPPSTTRDDGIKPSVPGHSSEMPCKADSSRPVPSTEPRKGRGRYAHVPSGEDTINSRFCIRKDRNNGVDFQYDAVIRSRQERKHMLGSDCECCREYYEAVGPLPTSRQPLWRTPTKRRPPRNFYASDDDKENADDVEEHRQLISRHRHHWHRPKTPPGYWDIGFPDTQEVLDINRRAAEMHKRKFVEVESEAKNGNGRYMERAQRIS